MHYVLQHHRAVGQVWAEVARDLADTTIIPLDVMNFAREVKKLVDVLKKDFGDILRKNGIKFGTACQEMIIKKIVLALDY